MDILQNFHVKFKGNGATALPRRHDPAAGIPSPAALTPKQHKSLFAREIWNAERKPSFARSSIYGFAR